MFDKSQIMKSAWTIARRFKGNGWTLTQRLAHGLKLAWQDAKDAAAIAKTVASHFVYLAARTTESLQREAQALENSDYVREQGMDWLTQIQTELRRRAA